MTGTRVQAHHACKLRVRDRCPVIRQTSKNEKPREQRGGYLRAWHSAQLAHRPRRCRRPRVTLRGQRVRAAPYRLPGYRGDLCRRQFNAHRRPASRDIRVPRLGPAGVFTRSVPRRAPSGRKAHSVARSSARRSRVPLLGAATVSYARESFSGGCGIRGVQRFGRAVRMAPIVPALGPLRGPARAEMRARNRNVALAQKALPRQRNLCQSNCA